MNFETPFVPQTITVHLGEPGQLAPNITLPFIEYIKNVASNEIYPTWPESALRANILAQISLAMNRVFTEFYRNQGYDYDITSSTQYDQSFVPNRDIFENISFIVDEIFNNYVVREGAIEPVFTQYCDGLTTTCPGLSQWGTVTLAEQGLSPLEILRNYYGENISIVNNAPVQDVPPSLPVSPLDLGDSGRDVQTLQIRLNRISANYPAIPKIPIPNGIFDQTTKDAVIAFQTIFSLEPDGIVGPATWYKIGYIYNAVKRLCELASEGLTVEEASRDIPEILSEGDSGVYVRLIQFLIDYISAYENPIPRTPIDSYYGPQTTASIRALQEFTGIPVTGNVDQLTYETIYDLYRGIINTQPESLYYEVARPHPGEFLVLGSEGEDVLEMQHYINVIKFMFPGITGIEEDGIFGPDTQSAVSIIQLQSGLPVTGAVGALTWDVIAGAYDDFISGSLTNIGQYPGDQAFQ